MFDISRHELMAQRQVVWLSVQLAFCWPPSVQKIADQTAKCGRSIGQSVVREKWRGKLTRNREIALDKKPERRATGGREPKWPLQNYRPKYNL